MQRAYASRLLTTDLRAALPVGVGRDSANSRLMARRASWLATAAVAWCVGAAPAVAGEFTVVSCRDAATGLAAGWSVQNSATDDLEVRTTCGSGSGELDG